MRLLSHLVATTSSALSTGCSGGSAAPSPTPEVLGDVLVSMLGRS